MEEAISKQLKDRVYICKDFFSSFKRLPNVYQIRVLKRIEKLTEELSSSPEKASQYIIDLPSAEKYFPNNREILDSGELFPFRSVRLPKDEENKDVVVINFLSCYLVNKLGLIAIKSATFINAKEGLVDNKIYLVSCSYVSFDSYD